MIHILQFLYNQFLFVLLYHLISLCLIIVYDNLYLNLCLHVSVLSYLVTVLETQDGFHQLLGWTEKNKFDSNKDQIDEVTKTFKLVE